MAILIKSIEFLETEKRNIFLFSTIQLWPNILYPEYLIQKVNLNMFGINLGEKQFEKFKIN